MHSRVLRPLPSDFAEHATKRSVELKRMYGVKADSVIKRWRKEVGIRGLPSRFKSAPADFAEQAAKLTRRGLRMHYGTSWRLIDRWTEETGCQPVVNETPIPVLEVPEDFAAVAPTKSLTELTKHYRRGVKTVKRWLAETGVAPLVPKPGPRTKRKYAPRAPKPAPEPRVKSVKGRVILPAAARQAAPLIGRENEAAQHLRRHFPCVFRCTKSGTADQKGSLWRVGNAQPLTPDELLAKARRWGWDPDAWQRIAA
jgi:transposase